MTVYWLRVDPRPYKPLCHCTINQMLSHLPSSIYLLGLLFSNWVQYFVTILVSNRFKILSTKKKKKQGWKTTIGLLIKTQLGKRQVVLPLTYNLLILFCGLKKKLITNMTINSGSYSDLVVVLF